MPHGRGDVHVTPHKKADRTPREPLPNQRLLKGSQVEMLYGLPYRTIYDLYLRDKLRGVRINRTIWFEREDLDRLIEEHKALNSEMSYA